MIATTEDFTSHVVAHAGVPDSLAERVTHVVLAGIGVTLSPAARELVASELPRELGATVLSSAQLGGSPSIEQHAAALGVSPGHARELVASVCRVLVEELSTEAIVAIRGAVPASLATLLEAMAEPSESELLPPPAWQRPRETLAGGRPGSHHPLSEARGPGAHAESIASDNPHGATKLSSSAGTTQERHHETIADAHPGPASPISRSRS
ncbi:MAG TPA: DUF2267 domain-containing protein [Kofleriaceae bacterium]|nr:DUF2267 domain-containing protein [Kofleriaceae bacterium]